MAAVCSGASGVLEYAGGVSPTGAGICQRPSLCLPCEATDFCLFYLYSSRDSGSSPATVLQLVDIIQTRIELLKAVQNLNI